MPEGVVDDKLPLAELLSLSPRLLSAICCEQVAVPLNSPDQMSVCELLQVRQDSFECGPPVLTGSHCCKVLFLLETL